MREYNAILDVTSRRNMIYRILAVSWYYPNMELVESLVEGEFAAVLNMCLGCIEDEEKIEQLTDEYTRELIGRSNIRTLRRMLTQDYTMLFLAPTPENSVISLYESVYTCREHLLMQEAAVQTKRFYEQAGFQLKDSFKDMPDHIGVELEFMHWLTDMEYTALKQGNTSEGQRYLMAQKQFFQQHLSHWVQDFCHQVAERAESYFYREMAALTDKVMKQEPGGELNVTFNFAQATAGRA